MREPSLVTRASTFCDPEPEAGELRRAFDRIASFTVGAEEEYFLVDPETYELVPAAPYVIAATDGDARIAAELRASQVEAITRPGATVAQVGAELGEIRSRLAEVASGRAALVAAGTHPLATGPGEISDRPRYRALADANPWAARHVLTCGLHVHVAVGGADRALAVYNALRGYLPEIAALGANAPFFQGEDSGLASVRPKLNQFWPRAGAPPAFATWNEVASFARWARDGGAMPDESHEWWDMRLRPRYGTIEVRAADVQTRLEDAATVIALVQSLAFDLACRYDAGEQLPAASGERIAENAWLASRDGVRGWLIDLETGERVPTAHRLRTLAENLLPSAAALGCDEELLGIGRMVLEGGGAGTQRRAYRAGGPDSLMFALAADSLPALDRRRAAPSDDGRIPNPAALGS